MKKKMKKAAVFLMSLLMVVSFLPASVYAQGAIDTAQSCDLTIEYKDGTKPISDALFRVYRIADVDAYADMTLTPAFAAYRSSVSGLSNLNDQTQAQWTNLASTLKGLVLRDGLTPAANGTTDSTGRLVLSNLKVGLYLIIGSRVTTDDYYTYTCAPSIVFLPARDDTDNTWDYDVTVCPKYEKDRNPPGDDGDYITRKVMKIWDDEGYEANRPMSVTVHLLKDGEICDTVTLNKDNNWRWAWDRLDDDYEWEVVEDAVSGYAVSVTRTGITFSVTNKYVVPVSSELEVIKRITGDTPTTAATFTFVLSAQDNTYPMPAGSTGAVKEITITGTGKADFGDISFTKPGPYVYKVNERKGSAKGYVYDTTVYTVTYTVTQTDGVLNVTRTITDSKDLPAEALNFTNDYHWIPQTGVLWWPVPVLLCAGLISVMIGIIRRRRCY